MNEAGRTKAFVDLYTTALKAATKNPWLQSPKEGSEKWQQLDAARELVDEMKGDYGDFIRVQFAALKTFRTVPSPKHLISEKAAQRYTIHQKLKNRYNFPSYHIDGKELVVVNTGRRYPLVQVDAPTRDDPEANYAHYIARTNESGDPKKDLEALEYALVKLRYKEKIPPEPLLRKLREVREKCH
jgi:hypothetical protein